MHKILFFFLDSLFGFGISTISGFWILDFPDLDLENWKIGSHQKKSFWRPKLGDGKKPLPGAKIYCSEEERETNQTKDSNERGGSCFTMSTPRNRTYVPAHSLRMSRKYTCARF